MSRGVKGLKLYFPNLAAPPGLRYTPLMRPSKKFEIPPTGFYKWLMAQQGETYDTLSEKTREIDPQHGICPKTVRRVAYGERSDSKGIYLLMRVTGLAFTDFLHVGFLSGLGGK